jgi:hypothetical protein
MKKISDIFKRLSEESNPKRIAKIVEEGLHRVIYEIPDKPDLVLKFVTLALGRVNVEKEILESIKTLRILEEVDGS